MRSGCILVVEDEAASREMLGRMLRSHAYEVETVEDAAAAMEWLAQQTPDLILLDVGMPGLSGLQLLRWIRRQFAHDQLPVVLVTALVDSDDIVAGFEAGANDYVVKPINLPVLLARIGVALRIKEGVARLLRAERHRVMLRSLDETSRRLAEPMQVVIGDLEQLLQSQACPMDVRPKLVETLDWARQVGELIERFQRIAGYQSAPYTEGLEGFVAASLESAAQPPGPAPTTAPPAVRAPPADRPPRAIRPDSTSRGPH